MNNIIIKNIIRFILLIILQVLIFNNMNPGGIVSPQVYITFILLLPVRINKSFMLILAFSTGLTIDYFANTLGLNAAACVAIGFIRPGLIKLLFHSHEFIADEEPSPAIIGLSGFIRYTIILVFVQQLIIVFLEMLSFRNFWHNITDIIIGTIFSTILINIIVLLTTKKNK